MADYKTTQILSAADVAYIAGLIDGEGTITLTRKHRNEFRQLAISISSTERQLLDFVKSATGVGTITNKIAYNSAHSRSFAYAVYNRQALALLGQVTPFLLSYNARRAKLILDQYLRVVTRNGKYSEDQLEARRQFESAVLSIKANSIGESRPSYYSTVRA